MTAKEIFESIDLSQLPKEAADKFRKVEKATKGFTIESEKVNTFMRGAYKKIKESKPTALKNLKVEEKITKKEVKKGKETEVVENLEYKVTGTKKVSKKTPTPSKPKRKGETAMERAKKIRKKDSSGKLEPWKDALARAQKELKAEAAKAKSDADKAISTTAKALKTLENMIQNDPKLKGYPRTYGKQSKRIDANKDAKIKAKPAGKRVSKKGHKNQYGESKGGRVYWENRDNRSDRYAPNFPNKVFLEMGGETDDLGFPTGHTFLVVEVSPSGDKKLIKSTTDYMTALMSSAVTRGRKTNKNNRVVIVDKEDKKVIHEAFEAGGEITITPTQLINNPDALVGTTTMTELFECGGVTAYQEGGEVFVTPYPLTNAGSGDYVAGSNTMSNMFAKGGQVSLGMKKDLEFFEDIRVKTLNSEVKQGILLKYGFVEPEDAKKYEKESGYKFKEDKSIAGVIDVKENKTKMQGVEDGDKYFFFFNTTQPDRVVIIDAFDGDKLSATRADNKRAYLSLKLFLLDLRLETSGTKMAKGGYVAVGEKDGFWTIISTPTTKEKAKELLDMTTLPKGEKGKIVSVSEAMSHKNVLGKEYLESGGTIVAADPSAAMEDLNQTYGYESVYEKGGQTLPSAQSIIDKLRSDGASDKVILGLAIHNFNDYLKRSGSLKNPQSALDLAMVHYEIIQLLRPNIKMEKGGRLGFDGLAKKVAKRYEGKPVKAKYQKEYGKTYSKEEAMEVGRKVAAKVYGQQQAKMEMGGEITQPYSLINSGSADYVAGSNTMSNMFEKGGEVDGKLNLKVKDYLDAYLKGTKVNSPEYQESLMLILKGALRDANYHSEARQVDNYFPKAGKVYIDTPMEDVIEDKGVDIAKMAKWDGHKIIDAFAYYTNLRIGGGFGNKLMALKGSTSFAKGGELEGSYYFNVENNGDEFVMSVEQDFEGKFVERLISGYSKKPLNKRYLSYLTKQDLINYLERDFDYVQEISEESAMAIKDAARADSANYYVFRYQSDPNEFYVFKDDVLTIVNTNNKDIDYIGDITYQWGMNMRQFIREENDLIALNSSDWPKGLLDVVQKKSFAKGGSLMGHGLKSGDVIMSQEGYLTKILDKDGKPLFVNLQDGYRGREKPLPFAKGGAVSAMKIPDIAKKFGKTTADVFAQLQVGEKHEMEHTNDPKKARKIALDHLSKDLDYYTKLNKLGL